MAKREANTQLTKDGGLSDDDGFSVGAQVGGGPRATAAQMAIRKLAKPRGGRRPGTPGQARHLNSQTQPSLFQPNNSNTTNGTQGEQAGFGSSNGSQPNQTSQSFPPFGSSSNTGINTQFTAPSGAFSFSAGQSNTVNNPFANTPPPSTAGFSGNIFTLPAQKSGLTSSQKSREGEQPPLFAAHSPFHNGNQTAATPNHPQPSNNPFDISAGQQPQQSSQQGSSLFPQQQQQQQQASGNMFAQQQPSTAAKDFFASSKQPQPQTSNNPFGQGNSIFEQSQPVQRTNDLFAHVNAQQPSTNSVQDPTPPAPEDYSMMSTSPDTSPQTTPSGTLNGSNAQPQSSPTKDSTAPGSGLSLFDRVSSPATQLRTQPFWSPNKEASAAGAAGSMFDRVAKPTAEASAAPPSSSTQQASPSGGDGSLFERISKPPAEASTKSLSTSDSANYFKIPQASNTSDYAPVSSEDQQPVKKKLFGHSLAAHAAQPSSTSKSSVFSPKTLNNVSQPTFNLAQAAGNVSSSTVGDLNADSNRQAMASKKRKVGAPPDPFDGCTEDERVQLVTGWRLKMHDAGLQKRLRSNPSENEKAMLMKFYRMREQEIKAAKAGPLPGPVPGSKRKAAEQPHIDEAQGKKAKFADLSHDLQGTLSNGAGTTSSQTSNIFKDILGSSNSGKSMVNGIGGPKNSVHYPSLPSSSNDNSKPPLFPTALSTASSIPRPSESTAERQSNDLAFPGTPYQPPTTGLGIPNFSGSSSLFGLKPTSSSGSTSETTMPSAFQASTFGASASSLQGNPSTFSSSSQSSSHPSAGATEAAPAFKAPIFVSSTASTSETPSTPNVKSPGSSDPVANVSNPSALKVPTFGAGTASNFLSQFGKVAEKSAEEAKQKRKLEEYDSDEEDERTWERKDEEKQRVKKQKLEEIAKSKTAKMVDGKWQLVATSGDELATINAPEERTVGSSLSIFDQPRVPLTNGHNIFGHLSGEESGAEGSKTGDADDEDDGQDDAHDNEENEGEDGNGDEVREENTDAKGREKASSNPFQTRLSSVADPQGNAASPSTFDRLSKDSNGKPIGDTSQPDKASASVPFGQHGAGLGSGSSAFMTSNSFGKSGGEASDPKTNNSSSTSTINLFGQQPTSSGPTTAKTGESPTGDHTWKADTPIKFGNQSSTPAVNVTAPSPSKSPFAGLFGASKTNATNESSSKPGSSLFSTSPTKAPTTGFGFGFTPANSAKPSDTAKPVEPATKSSPPPSDAVPAPKPATSLFAAPPNNTFPAKPATNFFAAFNNIASPANPTVRSLAPPSTNASGATSRATSPGATTGESANESNADNDERPHLKDDQVDLMSARPGEENEDVLFEVKAKAMTYDAASEGDSKWVVKGVGPLRVMKHRVTGNTRLLLRAEPSGKIAVNARLLRDMTYESTSAKAIRVPIANATGKIDVYNFKVGKDDDAKKLAEILSANRPS